MYICTTCEYASTVKIGKCPNCNAYGTFFLDNQQEVKSKKKSATMGKILSYETKEEKNIFYPFTQAQYQRVFTQGYKQGGIYLLGGEPGIGKSTLVLQILEQIDVPAVVYFSGEEHVHDILRRRSRVCVKQQEYHEYYHTISLEDILATIAEKKPSLVVIDSIQTISSQSLDALAGSPNQVKYCADQLISYCRAHTIGLLCLGHVTKGGEIAGPKYLEHIVDVVLYLEGDRYGQYRVLRTSKNRFGGTDDAVVFRMGESGLTIVGNDFRLSQGGSHHGGKALTVGLENGRPILVEVEALLTKNYTNHPQRNVLGVDPKRLQLIIAILEKYAKCSLYQYDIFVNIPGEFTFSDSGLDVAIAAAIYSQYKNIPLDEHVVYIGEIGLSGYIVSPKLYDKRKGIIQDSFVIMDTLGKSITSILV